MSAPPHHDLPREVVSILDWWMPRVRTIFGDDLRSILLFGGVALGEFAPGWSDVDTYCIVRNPVTHDQADAMNALLAEMDDRFVKQRAAGWSSGQAVQGAVITPEQAAQPGRADLCFYAWSSHGVHKPCDPFSPFDRYLLAHHRNLLWGEDTMFAPPSQEALLEMTLRALTSFQNASTTAQTQGPIMLAGLLHWAARSLVFWRDGVMLPKTAALLHEIQNASPFAEAFQLALHIREQGSAHAQAHHTALHDSFRSIGEAFYELHKRVLNAE